MDLALGVVLGIGIAAALAAVWRAVRGPRATGSPEDADAGRPACRHRDASSPAPGAEQLAPPSEPCRISGR